jgi:hypothetical protein
MGDGSVAVCVGFADAGVTLDFGVSLATEGVEVCSFVGDIAGCAG